MKDLQILIEQPNITADGNTCTFSTWTLRLIRIRGSPLLTLFAPHAYGSGSIRVFISVRLEDADSQD